MEKMLLNTISLIGLNIYFQQTFMINKLRPDNFD